MRQWATLLRLLALLSVLVSGLASPAWAAKYLSVDQVEQLLVQLHGKPDGKVAAELGDIQLTQRVSSARLAHWEAEFSGSRAHEELLKLADMSAFLSPPASDVVADPRPDTKSQLQILSLAVQYVGKTIPRLPDFYAMRETTHFEGISPAGYLLGEGETALESTGAYNRTVTYHDGKEIPFESVGKREKEPALGLTSNGEFGPILVGVLRDALASKIAFLRWERGPNGSTAVFGYTVPENGSHFTVDTTIGNWARTAHPAYHGEIEIDPASGEVLRLSEIADTNPVEPASIAVEYAPVTIGGRSYICPVRGVAFSRLRVRPDGVAMDRSVWPIHAFLNDVAFTHYHEFVAEARIVANPTEGVGGDAAGSSGAPAQEDSASTGGAVPSAAGAGAPDLSSGAPVASSATIAASPQPGPNTKATPESKSDEAAGGAVNSPSNASAMPNAGATVATASNTETTAESKTAEAVVPRASIASNVPASGTVLHAQSKLVLVDVVVTDRDKPVKGLERSRFHVFEDGHERPIASFDESRPPPSVTIAQSPELPPNTYSNTPTYPETGAVNVLLLDALNTPMGDQEQVRRQMIHYLSTIKPGTEMAVFTLSSRLRMAVGFTTDVTKLRLALDNRKSLPRSTGDVGAGNGESISSTLTQMATGVGNANLLGSALVSAITDFAADMKTYETDQRVPMTLDAFGQLARYLAAVPGRKNLIWFAGSFPIGLGPDGGASIPLKDLSDYSDAVRATTDLLSAARVSVYPVDARGVLTAPGTDATNTQSLNGQSPSDDASFGVQTSMQQGALNTIAMETGGHVYSTGNDLEAAVEKIAANGSYYYSLSYVPPEVKPGKSKPEFRTVEVKVDGAKYQLAYRRGYYAEETGNLSAENGGMAKPMTEAAVLGAPPSTQILFQARVLPGNAPELNGAALDGNAAGEKSSGFPGGTHRYAVDLSVQLQDLTFAEKTGGARHAQLQCALVAYDNEGQVLNSLGRGFHIDLPPEQYQKLLATGGAIPVRLALDLPARDVVLRIVLYDPASAKTGSLEIPVQVAGKQP